MSTSASASRRPGHRVLVVPSWFPSAETPLAGTFILDQAAALVRRGDVDVHVAPIGAGLWLSPRQPVKAATGLVGLDWSGVAEPRLDPHGFHVHTVRPLWWSDHLFEGGRRRVANQLYALCRQLERRGQPIDVIHAHVGEPGGRIARRLAGLLGIPFVVTEHMSPFPFTDLIRDDGSLDPDLKRAYTEANELIAVGTAQARDVAAWIGRDPIVIPEGTAEEIFYPPERRPTRDTFEFLAAGGLVRQKGFDILLPAFARAMAERPGMRLTIAGAGPEGESLRRLASSLLIADQVRWLGATSRDDMPAVFRDADAFVLSSRHESFGVVCVEALATGLPVIATDCGGPRDTVTKDNGIFVPVEDVDALAAAMVRLHDEHARFDSAAIRADFIARLSLRVVANKLVEVYDRVTSPTNAVREARDSVAVEVL